MPQRKPGKGRPGFSTEQAKAASRKAWDGHTEAERSEVSKKRYAGLSQAQKDARAEKIRASMKRVWTKMSPEARAKRGGPKSDETIKRIGAGVKSAWDGRDKLRRQEIMQKVKKGYPSERRSQVTKDMFAGQTKAQRQQRMSNAVAARLRLSRARKGLGARDKKAFDALRLKKVFRQQGVLELVEAGASPELMLKNYYHAVENFVPIPFNLLGLPHESFVTEVDRIKLARRQRNA